VNLSCFEKHAHFSGTLLFNEPLHRHTYYRIGGPASILAFPKDINDIHWLSRNIQKSQAPFFVLGQGSNVLASDSGFPGIVIRMNQVPPSVEEHRDFISTQASLSLTHFLRKSSQKGWGGLEFLAGIPGSVGGAIAMNAGTHLGATQTKLRQVEVLSLTDPDQRWIFTKKDLNFEYRRNLFLPKNGLIWSAQWEIDREDPKTIEKKLSLLFERRKKNQPTQLLSCGSVFKNPPGKYAWEIMDALGLRGYRIGNAQFSEKHSNFILNLKNAQAKEVRALIVLAKQRAKTQLGITLEEEVMYLGAQE